MGDGIWEGVSMPSHFRFITIGLVLLAIAAVVFLFPMEIKTQRFYFPGTWFSTDFTWQVEVAAI
jgi:hypothetical protein